MKAHRQKVWAWKLNCSVFWEHHALFVPLWFRFCSFCLEGPSLPLLLYTRRLLPGPGAMSLALWSPSHCFRRLGAFCASSNTFLLHLYDCFTGLKVGESVWEQREFLKWRDDILCVFLPWVLAEDVAQKQGFNSIGCMTKWRKARMAEVKVTSRNYSIKWWWKKSSQISIIKRGQFL